MAAALRGWRSHRLYVPSERVSVVVMFNHLADAHAGGGGPARRRAGRRPAPASHARPAADWLGAYIEPETGLSVRIEAAADGQVRLRYGHFPDLLDVNADGSASSDSVRLRPEDGGLWMDRPGGEPELASEPVRSARRPPMSPAAIAARNWMPN